MQLDRLTDVSKCFQIGTPVISVRVYGSGHIHDTFLVETGFVKKKRECFILQRINDHVFPSPELVMENLGSLIDYIEKNESSLNLLPEPIPARNGRLFHVDEDGKFWRMFVFVPDTHTIDVVETPDQAWQAAAAFGRFLVCMKDFPVMRLHETISDFHNTKVRFRQLEQAISDDMCGRVKECRNEIAFALERKVLAGFIVNLMDDGSIPLRVVHNDTKINNVLFDSSTNKAVTVIDLDTVMPGSVLFDVGDMIRSYTPLHGEDGISGDAVGPRRDILEAILDGYLFEAGEWITLKERELLIESGKMITFETGIRFLTDFLNGDTYFKISFPGQNLYRCRAHFSFVRAMEKVN